MDHRFTAKSETIPFEALDQGGGGRFEPSRLRYRGLSAFVPCFVKIFAPVHGVDGTARGTGDLHDAGPLLALPDQPLSAAMKDANLVALHADE